MMKRIALSTAATVAVTLLLASSAQAAHGTGKFDAQMKPVLHSYLKIQKALAGDSTKGVAAAAKEVEKAAAKLQPKAVTGPHAGHYDALPGKIRQGAEAVAAAKDIQAARKAFEDLSRPIVMWAEMSKPDGVYVMYCPHAKAKWVQGDDDLLNPYYGSMMLKCGNVVSAPGGKMDHGKMDHGKMDHGKMDHGKMGH